jgi:hypothetical protein
MACSILVVAYSSGGVPAHKEHGGVMTMYDVASSFAKEYGSTITLLIAIVLAACWGLKTFSEKWLDNKFSEKLKELDRKNDAYGREFQSKLDRELDRAYKLYAGEFETLSIVWELLQSSYWITRRATSRMYQIVNYGAVPESELNDYIRSAGFKGKQLTAMLAATSNEERQALHLEFSSREKLAKCSDSFNELEEFIRKKAVFIRLDMKEDILKIVDLIDCALSEYELRINDIHSPVNRFMQYSQSDALKDGLNELKEIENTIRDRLWSATDKMSFDGENEGNG